jgi:nitrogen fixation protein FixH
MTPFQALDSVSKPSGPVFTGRAFLICLLVGFGVVFAMNFTMAYLAIKTFAGVEVPSSFEASQTFGAELAKASLQQGLGWHVDAHLARRPQTVDLVDVAVDFRDRTGHSPAGLSVVGRLEHLSDKARDRDAQLVETAPGHFTGTISNVSDGGWLFVVEAKRNQQRVFMSRNRTIVNTPMMTR